MDSVSVSFAINRLVELLIGVSWPAVLLVLIVIFRKDISDLIRRLRAASREGVQFGPAAQRSPLENGSQGQQSGEALFTPPDHLAPEFRPLYEENLDTINQLLPNFENSTGKSRDELLLSALAEALPALKLERAYKFIFGSQLNSLRFLRDNGGQANINEIETIFENAKAEFPGIYGDATFDQWHNYLRVWKMIEIEGDTVTLTPFGRALNPYAAGQGYTLQPAG